MLAGEPQALLQVVFHLRKSPDHAQEADDAGEPRDRVRPSDEFRPVGRRQAKQLADDRQRQHSRISLDEVGRASIREQLASKIVGDGTNMRLHIEDRAAAEGFVDDPPQASVIRLVHGQHVVGERADERRHPPPQPGNAAALPSQCECLAVLQHAGRRLVCRRDPDLANDREPGRDDRSESPQPFDAAGRIPEKRLIRKINPRCHRSTPSISHGADACATALRRFCRFPVFPCK
jgi:hypothetical protein